MTGCVQTRKLTSGSAARVVRSALSALALALALGPLSVAADTVPARLVVLELYTSQGCASCPPADEMMLELAQRDDVIALALHVDYWDYIGWPDTFADHAHTERQQRYARRNGHSTIYTPQVVINGTQVIEGFRVMQVMEAIASQQTRPAEVTLTLTRTDVGALEVHAVPAAGVAQPVAMASRRNATVGLSGSAVIGGAALVGSLAMSSPVAEAAPPEPAVAADDAALVPATVVAVPEIGPYVVQLVRYDPSAQVEILGGENAGLTAVYANVVRQWVPVANWDLRAPLALTLPLEGDGPVVVLIQEVGQGEIIAAARLR